MKLTLEKIDYYIADESKAAKEYASLGLFSLERDERKHKRFFQRMRKRLFRKGL